MVCRLLAERRRPRNVLQEILALLQPVSCSLGLAGDYYPHPGQLHTLCFAHALCGKLREGGQTAELMPQLNEEICQITPEMAMELDDRAPFCFVLFCVFGFGEVAGGGGQKEDCA